MPELGPQTLDVAGLQALLDELRRRGYAVVGPTVRAGAVVPAEIESTGQLPHGVYDEQAPGRYRLRDDLADSGSTSRRSPAFFGFAAAAQSWKSYFLPARQLVWRVTADGTDAGPPEPEDPRPLALLGVRACDLHAIRIQDGILAERAYADADYVARRRDTFIVSVTCGNPGGTCFCVSMGTGPRPDAGYDLSLVELTGETGSRFLVETGTARGADVLAALPHRPAEHGETDAADAVAADAASRMGRTLDTDGIRDLLYDNAEHPRWDDVANRCLTCGNCTLVCPTCFCTSVDDVTDLRAETAERWRVWDSCFTLDFSAVHGGTVRDSARSRYRQWMTHKLASWIDQFGSSGCVGCGRCITWCPVGIDITEELAAIRGVPEIEHALDH